MKKISATQFKAECLALMDKVASSGQHLVVFKHGKPVIRVIPATSIDVDTRFAQSTLAGSVSLQDDVMEPVVDARVWDAESGLLFNEQASCDEESRPDEKSE